MQMDQVVGYAPRTRSVADELSSLSNGCVGCTSCRGLCDALLDALLVPGLIVKGGGK